MKKHFAVFTGIAMIAVAIIVVTQTQGTDVRGSLQSGGGSSVPTDTDPCAKFISDPYAYCVCQIGAPEQCGSQSSGSSCVGKPDGTACTIGTFGRVAGVCTGGVCVETSPPPPPSDDCQGKDDGTACTIGTFGRVAGVCREDVCVETPPTATF